MPRLETITLFYNREMGTHSCGVMNENGERLADFCALNNLVIGGTLFDHRDMNSPGIHLTKETRSWYDGSSTSVCSCS